MLSGCDISVTKDLMSATAHHPKGWWAVTGTKSEKGVIYMYITEKERQKIIADMEELLSEYGYEYSTDALNRIIDEWGRNKETIISLFKNHPNYREGQFMVAFDQDYDRAVNRNALYEFASWIYDCLLDQIELDEMRCTWEEAYTINRLIREYDAKTVDADTVSAWKSILPDAKLHEGMKTSRAVNKICGYLGLDKKPEYNRKFARYADGLNPLKVVRHTVISVNPLDYLTMSFGNSWASCHTIDKENKRGMPNTYEGQYSSGTISYMLDGTSFIMYTIDKNFSGEDYWRSDGKINRQMFHLGEDFLVQGRMYPQDNDGAEGIYTDFRAIAQKVIADCKQIPNLWTLRKGTEAASQYIDSVGTHYQDYRHYDNCTLSIRKGADGLKRITVGHNPICVTCGREHTVSENISCCAGTIECDSCGCCISFGDTRYTTTYGDVYCEDCGCVCDRCGEVILQDDAIWIDSEGVYVCEDCASEHYHRCGECGEYFSADDVCWVESVDGYVCDHCLEEYYFRCEECGDYFRNGSVYECTYVESTDKYVCDDCLKEYYFCCDSCGNYFPAEEACVYEEGEICKDCYAERMEAEGLLVAEETEKGETA